MQHLDLIRKAINIFNINTYLKIKILNYLQTLIEYLNKLLN